MQEIKLWNIDGNSVSKIIQAPLNYEGRLENWLIEDITILSDRLIVIGSQVVTSYGKQIDILAMNSVGELVIIELKRDKTYREVIAQILDYATWVKGLSYEEINNIFNKYGNSEHNEVSDYFAETFDIDSGEIEFNSDHKMLIVGSTIDDSTVRIIEYLSSEPYSININAVNFNYFKDTQGKEYLAQSFVKPENNLTEESRSKKRNRDKSIISTLFDQGKLTPGQTVYLKPAIEQGHDKAKACAEIMNKNTHCLKREDDENLYSFSRLRRVLTDELSLKDVKKYWGFGVRNDWITETNKNLSELLNE